jgi:aminopeptidase N
LLELTASEQHFEFDQVPSPPVPSLLRGFSAPVSLETQLTPAQLAMLWSRDTDAFNRWQSGQTLGIQVLRELAGKVHAGEPMTLDAVYVDAWRGLLQDEACDPGLLAELLLLPDEPALSEGLPRMDIDGHAAARRHALRTLSAANRGTLLARYHALADDGPYQFAAQAIGRRSLRNRCLEMLLADPDDEILELALAQITHGSNMTERFAALASLCEVDRPQRQQGIDIFYSQWQHKPSAIDKWFNAQALSRLPGAIDRFLALEQHSAMDIGNMPRAMAFYGGFFRQNRCGFHEPDGRAYQVLAERAIFIDAVKPGTTYWLLPQLLQWRRMDEGRAQKMRSALETILAADISSGLYETVSKALAGESV